MANCFLKPAGLFHESGSLLSCALVSQNLLIPYLVGGGDSKSTKVLQSDGSIEVLTSPATGSRQIPKEWLQWHQGRTSRPRGLESHLPRAQLEAIQRNITPRRPVSWEKKTPPPAEQVQERPKGCLSETLFLKFFIKYTNQQSRPIFLSVVLLAWRLP